MIKGNYHEFLASLPKLTPEEASCLQTRPTKEETVQVVFSRGPDKASDSGALNARVAQSFWQDWEPVVVQEVMDFFEIPYLSQQISRSNMVLVPKSLEPKKVSDYWPISVCDVIYKINSKMLAFQLRPFIAKLISKN